MAWQGNQPNGITYTVANNAFSQPIAQWHNRASNPMKSPTLLPPMPMPFCSPWLHGMAWQGNQPNGITYTVANNAFLQPIAQWHNRASSPMKSPTLLPPMPMPFCSPWLHGMAWQGNQPNGITYTVANNAFLQPMASWHGRAANPMASPTLQPSMPFCSP